MYIDATGICRIYVMSCICFVSTLQYRRDSGGSWESEEVSVGEAAWLYTSRVYSILPRQYAFPVRYIFPGAFSRHAPDKSIPISSAESRSWKQWAAYLRPSVLPDRLRDRSRGIGSPSPRGPAMKILSTKTDGNLNGLGAIGDRSFFNELIIF